MHIHAIKFALDTQLSVKDSTQFYKLHNSRLFKILKRIKCYYFAPNNCIKLLFDIH